LNHSVNTDYKIIVLFDNKMNYDKNIEEILINIKIIRVDLIKTTYDRLGHSMYIHYLEIITMKLKPMTIYGLLKTTFIIQIV